MCFHQNFAILSRKNSKKGFRHIVRLSQFFILQTAWTCLAHSDLFLMTVWFKANWSVKIVISFMCVVTKEEVRWDHLWIHSLYWRVIFRWRWSEQREGGSVFSFVSPLDQNPCPKHAVHPFEESLSSHIVCDRRSFSKQRKAVFCVGTTDLLEFHSSTSEVVQEGSWEKKRREASTPEEKETCHQRGEIAGWRRIWRFFCHWELSVIVHVHGRCVADVCSFFFQAWERKTTVPRSHVVCWCIEEWWLYRRGVSVHCGDSGPVIVWISNSIFVVCSFCVCFFDQDKSRVVPRSERVPAGMCPIHFQANGTVYMSWGRKFPQRWERFSFFWFGVKSRSVLSWWWRFSVCFVQQFFDDVHAVDSLATGDMNKLLQCSSQQSWTIWGPCRQVQNAHSFEDDITCVGDRWNRSTWPLPVLNFDRCHGCSIAALTKMMVVYDEDTDMTTFLNVIYMLLGDCCEKFFSCFLFAMLVQWASGWSHVRDFASSWSWSTFIWGTRCWRCVFCKRTHFEFQFWFRSDGRACSNE